MKKSFQGRAPSPTSCQKTGEKRAASCAYFANRAGRSVWMSACSSGVRSESSSESLREGAAAAVTVCAGGGGGGGGAMAGGGGGAPLAAISTTTRWLDHSIEPPSSERSCSRSPSVCVSAIGWKLSGSPRPPRAVHGLLVTIATMVLLPNGS